MKTITPSCRIFLLAILLLAGKFSTGQVFPGFQLFIANDHLTSPNVFEFDVIMRDTSSLYSTVDSNSILVRTVQHAFTINPAFTPVGTPTITMSATGLNFLNLGLIQSNNLPTLSAFQAATGSAGLCTSQGPVLTPNTSVVISHWVIAYPVGTNFNCAPPNISMIRPTDNVPGGNVNLRFAVTKWFNTICNPATSTTINGSGNYTNQTGGTLVSQTINGKPTLTDPVNVTVDTCGTANFTVTGTNNTGFSNPITYQWLQNGLPILNGIASNGTTVISGATTDHLVIANPTVSFSGNNYSVVGTICGSRTTAAATLTVNPCLGCVNAPTVNPGGTGGLGLYSGCDQVQLNGTFAGSATSITWSSPTGGTFLPNATTPNAIYVASAADRTNGSVTLTITTNNPLGSPCNAATATAIVTVIPTDDNNACTLDACVTTNGNGVATHTAVSTEDNNACTTDGCLSTSGVFHIPFTQAQIDDLNLCTIDGCLSTTGVFHTPLTPGQMDDNNACTDDGCLSATGVFHNPVNTNDNNPCTQDGCVSTTGQFHTPLTNTGGGASDGLNCTQDNCSSGATVHPSVNTDDANPCTQDGCAEPAGVFHTNLTNTGGGASDGLLCTQDNCSSGVTVHPAVNSDDSNPCTQDGCVSTTGIFHTPLTNTGGGASDGLSCTQDNCSSGATVHPSINTDDSNPCTQDGCTEATGVFHTNLTSTGGGASDGLACTQDNCSSGATVHPTVNSDDGNSCTTDGCTEPTGVFHNPTNTNDNNPCTDDGCNSSTGGVFHNPVNTSDNNPCTQDGCVSTTGIFHTPQTNTGGGASDGLNCTQDNCNSGLTVHPSINTDDANPCTQDGCTEALGVFHTNLTSTGGGASDGLNCTQDNCSSGATVHPGVVTDDSNPCTNDGCAEPAGIFHTALTQAQLTDNNACTIDACVSTTGITHTPLTASQMDDSNPCTDDGCISTSGVFHNFNQNIIPNDGNACTVDQCNPFTGLPQHPLDPEINDNDPCTIDGCNSSTGVKSHVNSGLSATATITTPVLCYNGTGCVKVSVTGGFGPFGISGQTPPVFAQDTTICGLSPNTYVFGVVDALGCEVATTQVDLLNPPKLEVTTTQTPSGCANDGTATATASGGTGTYHYLWSPTSPPQTTATATNIGAGVYTVVVTDDNGCTTSSTIQVQSTSNGSSLPAPVFTSATSTVCKGQCLVYTVAPIPGATSYQWTLPTGATGYSTTNSITVCFSTKFKINRRLPNQQFYICVKALGACGASPTTCVTIIPIDHKPGKPGPITGGPFTVCPPSTGSYCVPNIPGVTFNWSFKGNSNPPLTITGGQGTNCVTVNIPLGYNGNMKLVVKAVNCKGSGKEREVDIKTVKKPATPGSISGPNNFCKSLTKVYTINPVNGATGYLWSVTNGAQVVLGQGTTSVSIDFSTSTSNIAIVSVIATGPCGNSSAKTKRINLQNCKIGSEEFVDNQAMISTLSVFPNPTSGKATLTFNSLKDGKYNLRVIDVIGKLLLSEDVSMIEGINNKEINLENVSKGIYFVTIVSEGNEAQTLRIIVE